MGDFFQERLRSVPIVAILRGLQTQEAVELTWRLWDAGVRLVEIPLQSPAASRAIEVLAARSPDDRWIGAGTITSVRLLERARDAGAHFSVAPGIAEDVLLASRNAQMPHLPGVATPSEIQRALNAGTKSLKAFPARQLGEGWLQDMHGPFPEAFFVATGGVSLENAPGFIAAGAAVALGGCLTDPSSDLPIVDLVTSIVGARARA